MRASILSVLALTISLVGHVSASSFLQKKATLTVAAPDCSLICLGTFIPKYCDSLADMTCICTNTELAAELLPCALAACNVTDSLQLARYQAEACDVPNDKTRYWRQIVTYLVLIPVTTLFVALRIFARRLNVGLGPDDWVLLVAFAFYLSMTSTAWVIIATGFGQHTFWLLTRQVMKALKFFYICELLYLSVLTFTKLSLLLFFRRIFPSDGFRIATVCVGAFIVASNISLMMTLALQCLPVHGFWTNWMYKVPPVKCINSFAAVYVAAGLSIFHDVVILVMPIPTLIGLNLEMRKKANLMVMFGVGSFVIVASVIRLPSLMKMGNSTDPSYDQAPVAVWTNIETSVGIICACLPACRSLIGFYFPRLKMSLNNSSGNGRKTPCYSHNTPSTTKEYFNKKCAARDSFIELDDRSGTGSQEELKSKKSRTAISPTKSAEEEDGDGDSILHIQTNSNGPIEKRFVPADREGFGHMVTVVAGNPGRGEGSSLGSPGDGGRDRTGRDIVMTRTLDQTTTSRM
ncbi:hypothetical protein BKA65DRAFT_566961 [Rhexocercosporidium sp. MPI-PUGE-AT-0058]|nr:hypothetical protein BKA65DRAFT_566961 [Rhexocercosporidium sp. MPI-PUGE-AT-0058]